MMSLKEILDFLKTAFALIPIILLMSAGFNLAGDFAVEFNFPDWTGTIFGLVFYSLIITALIHGRKGGQYMVMEYWTIVEALERKKTFGLILKDFDMKEANILRLQLQGLKNIKSTIMEREDGDIEIHCIKRKGD